MRNRISLTALAALVAFSALVTMASAEETKPTGLSVRAGAFFPTNKDTRDATEKTWFTAGVEYKIGQLSLGEGQHAYYGLSADYAGSSDVYQFPVLVCLTARTNGIFYSLGAGVTFAKGFGESKTGFGYRGSLGYEFGKGPNVVTLEVGYLGASIKDVNDKLNGVFVDVGMRF